MFVYDFNLFSFKLSVCPCTIVDVLYTFIQLLLIQLRLRSFSFRWAEIESIAQNLHFAGLKLCAREIHTHFKAVCSVHFYYPLAVHLCFNSSVPVSFAAAYAYSVFKFNVEKEEHWLRPTIVDLTIDSIQNGVITCVCACVWVFVCVCAWGGIKWAGHHRTTGMSMAAWHTQSVSALSVNTKYGIVLADGHRFAFQQEIEHTWGIDCFVE